MQEAEEAFASSPADYIRPAEVPQASRQAAAPCLSPDLKDQALAVDAACSGNPGKMEYYEKHSGKAINRGQTAPVRRPK